MDTFKSPLRDRIQNNRQSITSGARVLFHRSINLSIQHRKIYLRIENLAPAAM